MDANIIVYALLKLGCVGLVCQFLSYWKSLSHKRGPGLVLSNSKIQRTCSARHYVSDILLVSF